jgi:hypothetical protein
MRGSPAAKVVNCGQIGRMALFLPAKRRYMPPDIAGRGIGIGFFGASFCT